MSEHYFASRPSSPPDLRVRTVTLAGAPREVTVASGVFSSYGLDRGTAVLLAQVPPPPPSGRFLDLGCGWGPIALTLALLSPDAEVVAVDVNARALHLLRRNAKNLSLPTIGAFLPDDVDPHLEFDLIWSNPPIRIGKAAVHELLLTWLVRLRVGGSAYLVVAKQLGADSLQRWIAVSLGDTFEVGRLTTDKGFRVLQVRRQA